MNGFNATALIGSEVTFLYNGEQRQVEVEQYNECANGSKVLVCKDINKNMAYRSFNVEKVKELTVVGPKGWVRL